MTSGTVLVTSGPTRAYLDRVRYIANSSTGALGARIVEALAARGIPVRHIFGEGAELPAISASPLFEPVPIVTIDDLVREITAAAASGRVRAIVHAMAVLDYTPEHPLGEKRKSGTDVWDVRLVRTPKMTALMRKLMPDACTIGFKLEAGITEPELIRRATASLTTYRLDLVVANDLDHVETNAHEALLIGPGGVLSRAFSKKEIAGKIADFIEARTTLE